MNEDIIDMKQNSHGVFEEVRRYYTWKPPTHNSHSMELYVPLMLHYDHAEPEQNRPKTIGAPNPQAWLKKHAARMYEKQKNLF